MMTDGEGDKMRKMKLKMKMTNEAKPNRSHFTKTKSFLKMFC
jgi:hypothetical protein